MDYVIFSSDNEVSLQDMHDVLDLSCYLKLPSITYIFTVTDKKAVVVYPVFKLFSLFFFLPNLSVLVDVLPTDPDGWEEH